MCVLQVFQALVLSGLLGGGVGVRWDVDVHLRLQNMLMLRGVFLGGPGEAPLENAAALVSQKNCPTVIL